MTRTQLEAWPWWGGSRNAEIAEAVRAGERSLAAIGAGYGVSRQRVHQIAAALGVKRGPRHAPLTITRDEEPVPCGDRPVRGRGMCGKHYMRWYRGRR